MTDDRQQQHPEVPFIPSRRRMLATAALAPVLSGAVAQNAYAVARTPVEPVMTQPADWTDVGRAAVSGDLALVAREVQDVLAALRRAGVELVELHHHNLADEPRLFFVHFWAIGDAVQLARALRPALEASDVLPMPGAVA
ncbi:DUF1259 domain-containing protein [Streptomyces sp. NPDC004542]|uniref:DUF1259 domain-containing protein n=1 Tax=Streptomyces sp. NPDC004542 TaxID=3154281 RepID=UPI00339F3DE4